MNQHATTEELLKMLFSVVRAAAVATQLRGKHVSPAMNQRSTIEERCFLRGPYQGVINRTSIELSSVVGYVPDGRNVSRQC
jgi:hypothetical protein